MDKIYGKIEFTFKELITYLKDQDANIEKLRDPVRELKLAIITVTNTPLLAGKEEGVPLNIMKMELADNQAPKRSNQTVYVDKSLRLIYSMHFCLFFSNLISLIPSSREYLPIFGSTYVISIAFCTLLSGSFIFSFSLRYVKLQSYSENILSGALALLGNLLIAYSLYNKSMGICILGL